jgi:hypothetical protein
MRAHSSSSSASPRAEPPPDTHDARTPEALTHTMCGPRPREPAPRTASASWQQTGVGRLRGTVSRPGGRGAAAAVSRKVRTPQGKGAGESQDGATCRYRATESRPPMAGRRQRRPAQARVKRCGKSAPASGATPAAGNPHLEQGQAWDGRPGRCPQVGRTDGWPPRRRPARDPAGQNPAYKPAHRHPAPGVLNARSARSSARRSPGRSPGCMPRRSLTAACSLRCCGRPRSRSPRRIRPG